jgi:hypothetical protein
MTKSPRSTTRPSFPVNWFVEFRVANFTFPRIRYRLLQCSDDSVRADENLFGVGTVENDIVGEHSFYSSPISAVEPFDQVLMSSLGSEICAHRSHAKSQAESKTACTTPHLHLPLTVGMKLNGRT